MRHLRFGTYTEKITHSILAAILSCVFYILVMMLPVKAAAIPNCNFPPNTPPFLIASNESCLIMNVYSHQQISSATAAISNYGTLAQLDNNGSIISSGLAVYNAGALTILNNSLGSTIQGSSAIYNENYIGQIKNNGQLLSTPYAYPTIYNVSSITDSIQNDVNGFIDNHSGSIENRNSTVGQILNFGTIDGGINNTSYSSIVAITNAITGKMNQGIWNTGSSQIESINNYGYLLFIGNETWGGPSGSTIDVINNYGRIDWGIQNLNEIGSINLYQSAQMGSIHSCGSIRSIAVNDSASLSGIGLTNGGCGYGVYYPQHTARIQAITIDQNAFITGGIGNEGGVINSISNQGSIGGVGNYVGVGGDVATIVSIINYAKGTINGINNQANIQAIQNYGLINGINNTGSLEILQNDGIISQNINAGYYAAISSSGDLQNLINNGQINANYNRALEISNSQASVNIINNGIINGSINIVGSKYSAFLNNGTIGNYAPNIYFYNFTGTFTQSSTGVFFVGLAPNLSGHIAIDGKANLAGTLNLFGNTSAPAYLPSTIYKILTATKGINGRFDAFINNFNANYAFLNPQINYGNNDVTLGFALTPFSTVAKNINERNVGNALTVAALGPVNTLGAPILNGLFSGNYQNAQAILDTVSGSGLAGVQSTSMQVGETASSAVADQIAFWRSGETMDATGRTSQEGNKPSNFLAYAPINTKVPSKGVVSVKGPGGNLSVAVAPRTFRAWGSMFGGGANYLSDAGRGAAASNIGYYGGLIGVDYQIQPNILVGVAVGGSSSSFNVGSLSTNGNLTGFHAGVYGAYTMGNSYIALNETFSAYNNQTSRKAGGYAYLPYEQLSAQFGSTEFRTRGELGHGFLMGGLKATPFVAAEIAAYQSGNLTEQSNIYASTFALKNNGQSINSLPTFAGLRLSNAVTLSNGWRLAPVGSVAYVHEFFPQRQFTNMLVSMPGTDFNVAGPRSTYNLVQTKIGAQLNLNERLALFTDFQGEFSPVSQSYAGKGGVKYVW